MRKLITALAATAAMVSTTSVQAADAAKCVPPEKAEALVTYLLPAAIETAQSKCSLNLSGDAPLLQRDSAQFQKYVTASDEAWPEAKGVIRQVVGERLPEGVDIETLRPFIEAMVPALLEKEIKPEHCETIDKVYGLLEPLPTSNLSSLAIMLAVLGSKNDKNSKFNICQPAAL
ncbi:hypothetical protein MNBD_ALPHA04-897 [hydrothermal vent metagenome]|uniref:Uncharacterized protein n=1 Tax=hydrothermal vent metagenome TaxID=652676 RepID=A0A3B0SA23_9ZZZZ